MTEVTKSELARYMGVSPQMITKHVKAGTLDKCFTNNGKKLFLEKASKTIELSRKMDSKKTIQVVTPVETQEDPAIYNEESNNELDEILLDAQSPSQKVQIIKDYWLGKINRQKFMEAEGDLISVKDAKSAIETLLTVLNQYLNDQANNLKSNYPNIDNEILAWIADENNRQKEQLVVDTWGN